jgi:hypothetical protein
MLLRLFPRQIDNRFEGHRLALWLLALLVGLKLIVSLNSILNTAAVASGADGFPLDSYGADGARAVLMLFAIGAVANLTLALFGVAVLVRYRAMVPFVFLLSIFEHVGRRLVVETYSIERAQALPAAFAINMAVLALLLIGLALSLWPRKPAPSAQTAETKEEAA